MKDLAAQLRELDYGMLTTTTSRGHLASHPMSNNRQVDYDGSSTSFQVRTLSSGPKASSRATRHDCPVRSSSCECVVRFHPVGLLHRHQHAP